MDTIFAGRLSEKIYYLVVLNCRGSVCVYSAFLLLYITFKSAADVVSCIFLLDAFHVTIKMIGIFTIKFYFENI